MKKLNRRRIFGSALKRAMSVLLCACMVMPLVPTVSADSHNVRLVRDTQIGGERSNLFDYDWKFKLTSDDCSAFGYDDSDWRVLDLPHDWKIERGSDYNTLYGKETAWYRHDLYLPESLKDKDISLRFDCVQKNTTVYVNGKYAAYYPAGYSTFNVELTDLLNFGNTVNEIAVKVEYEYADAWWYTGAGIIRDVWLTVTDKVHVNYGGTYIYTDGKSTASIDAEIKNDTSVSKTVTVSETVLDADGKSVASSSKHVTVPAGGIVTDTQTLKVSNAKLWDTENPYLYTMKTELSCDGKIVDTYTGTFGFRTIEIDPERGFFLNGKQTKLKGAALHQDLGALGGVSNYEGTKKRLIQLKEMGINAIRTAHNICPPEWVELCDELGIMMINEGIVRWLECTYFTREADQDLSGSPKTSSSPTWSEVELRNWIRRDRNHPCVIFWSIGNEVPSQHSEEGYNIGVNLINMLNSEDPQKNGLRTLASDAMTGWSLKFAREHLDAGGYNYAEAMYDSQHAEYPALGIIGTEAASATASRGIYHFPADKVILNYFDNQVSSYGNSYVPWGSSNEDAYIADRDREFVLGEFIWNGHDYIGEPTPYKTKNTFFGIIDTADLPKDSYYFYQSVWTDPETAPMVHLLPYWDDSLTTSDGGEIDVHAYSNADSVELFLNGVSLGRQSIDLKTATVLHYKWKVPYADGTLLAKAYDKDGKVIATEEVKSFGAPAGIKLESNRTELTADGKDLLYVTASIVDKDGNFVANARNEVKFTVSGAGKLVGVDNGDSTDYDNYYDTERRAFSGKVVAIIMSDGTEGDITVSADSYNISSASPVTVKATHAQQITQITLGSIDGSSSITNAGGSLKLTAEISPSNADYPKVIYSVSDEFGNPTTAAYIDVYGNLTALGNGRVKVTATALDGSNVSDSAIVTVSGQNTVTRVNTINVSSDTSTVNTKSGRLQLSAAVSPANAALKNVAWSVSNACATIDESGLLTARYNGSVTVRATALDGSRIYGEKVITITGQEANFTPANKLTFEVIEGSTELTNESLTARVKATLNPTGASEDITWMVIDDGGDETALARIDEISADGTVATVTAQGSGEFYLCAYVKNRSAYAQSYKMLKFTATDIFAAKKPYDVIYGRDYDEKHEKITLSIHPRVEDRYVTDIRSGFWLRFKDVDFGIYGSENFIINAKIPSGTIMELRDGSLDGKVIKTFYFKDVKEGFADYTFSLPGLYGIHDLYFKFQVPYKDYTSIPVSIMNFRFTEVDTDGLYKRDPYTVNSAADFNDTNAETLVVEDGKVSKIKSGTQLFYNNAVFGNDGATLLKLKGAAGSDTAIKIYDGNVDGHMLASLKFPSTGSFDEFAEVGFAIPKLYGSHDLCFVFDGEISLESFRFKAAYPSAYSTIEAEDYDGYVLGIAGNNNETRDYDDNGRTVTTVRCTNNDNLTFKNIDFGNIGANTLKLRAKLISGATKNMKLVLDNSTEFWLEGRLNARDGFVEYTLDIPRITGKHDVNIFFALNGATVLFDSFSFGLDDGSREENILADKLVLATNNDDANKLVDGDKNTAWTSDRYPQTLKLDLGARYLVDNITLVPSNETASEKYKYSIALTNDAEAFESGVVSATDIIVDKTAENMVLGRNDINAEGRYLMITFEDGSGDISLSELTGVGTSLNVALNKPATASSTYSDGNQTAEKANNNILTENNRWCAATTSPASWTVDLGGATDLGLFEITLGGEYNYSFTLMGSLDGSSWYTVRTVRGANRFTAIETDVTARYLKVENLKAGTAGKRPAIANFAAYEGRADAESVKLDKSTLKLGVNESARLTATVLPETASNKAVVWKSSDESVVKVASDGTVSAISNGSATVSATTVSGALSAYCLVSVGVGSDISPNVLIKANEMKFAASGGFSIGSEGDINGQIYRRANTTNGYVTEDGSRIYAIFERSMFPEGFTLAADHYVKVGYRTKLSNGLNLCDFNPMPYKEGVEVRLWSGFMPGLAVNGTWDSFVYDLNNITGGSGFVEPAAGETVMDANGMTYMSKLCLKPYGGNGYTMDGTDYFDLLYVAFFDNEKDAESYDYFKNPDPKCIVTYVANGEVFETQLYERGDKLAYPATEPTCDGEKFLGWSVESGISLTYNLTVNAKFTAPIKPSALIPANEMTLTGLQGWVSNGLSEENGVYYHRFGVDSANLVDKDSKKVSGPNTHIAAVFNEELFPEDFKLSENRYIKLGFRAKLNDGYKNWLNCDIYAHSADGGKALWYGDYLGWRTIYGPMPPIVDNRNINSRKYDGTWETMVFDTSKDDAKIFSDNSDSYVEGLHIKPNFSDNFEMFDGDYFDLLYVAFFATEEEANAYDYFTAPSPKYTVTYTVNGTTFATQTYKRGEALIYPSDIPNVAGCYFTGWSVEKGSIVKHDITVKANFVTLIAGGDMVSPQGIRGWKLGEDGEFNGYTYRRFITDPTDGYVSGASAGDQNRGEYTGEFSRIYLSLTKDMFPDGFTMLEHKYIKIGYRGSIPGNVWGRANFNPMPYTGKETRLWGNNDPFVTYDGEWHDFVFDISTCNGGEQLLTADGKSVYEANCDTWLSKLCFKPQFASIKLTGEEYFDLLYIAFFDDLKAANDFEFIRTPDTVNVSVYACDGGSVDCEASFTAETGSELVLTAYPSDGYKMDGWYDVTNGQNRLLTRESALVFTPNDNIELEARFYELAVDIPQTLAIDDDADGVGVIYADGILFNGESLSVSSRRETLLEAEAKVEYADKFYPAYWVRVSANNTALVGVGSSVGVYPLGAGVRYMPVFGNISGNVRQKIRLYVDRNNSIIATDPEITPEIPERRGYTALGWIESELGNRKVIVYTPVYESVGFDGTTLTVNGKPVNDVDYNASVMLTSESADFTAWLVSIDGGTPKLLSYERTYKYNHVLSGNIRIYETSDKLTPGNTVHTLAAEYELGTAKFIASQCAVNGWTLIERGVLLSDRLLDKDGFVFEASGVIKGKIEADAGNASGVFIIRKGAVSASDSWYGRAYMIIKNDTTDEVRIVYAEEILGVNA